MGSSFASGNFCLRRLEGESDRIQLQQLMINLLVNNVQAIALSEQPTSISVGEVGQAFSLNGTDGFIEIPDAPALRPVSLSLEAWVAFDATSGIKVIFAKPVGTGTSDSYALWLQNGADGSVYPEELKARTRFRQRLSVRARLSLSKRRLALVLKSIRGADRWARNDQSSQLMVTPMLPGTPPEKIDDLVADAIATLWIGAHD